MVIRDEGRAPDAWQAELAGIRHALATRPFTTLEEANAFLAERMAAYNQRAQQELSGLSPVQLRELLAGDWESGGPLQLNPELTLDQLDTSILLVNARRFLEALKQAEPVRLTATGRLPRAFVAVLLDRFRWVGDYLEQTRAMHKVVDELDVWPMHITKVVLQLAGLVRRHAGALHVTREGSRLLAAERAGELFGRLFRTYFRRLNLAYLDEFEDAPEIQHGVPYALWVVSQLDDRWWLPDTLAQRLLPPVLRGPPGGGGRRKAPELEQPFPTILDFAIWRLVEPLADFALLEARPRATRTPNSRFVREFRRSAFCDRFLRFEFGGEAPRAKG